MKWNWYLLIIFIRKIKYKFIPFEKLIMNSINISKDLLILNIKNTKIFKSIYILDYSTFIRRKYGNHWCTWSKNTLIHFT